MGEVVYVGSCGGVFYALDAGSGEVVWTYDTARDGPPGQFHGDAVVTEELVVVGSDNQGLGHLYALERETGALRWKQGFSQGVGTQVFRHGDAVFAATASGEVVAVDLESGEIRWRVDAGTERAGGRAAVDPLLTAGRFFVGWRTGAVEAYDLSTGKRIWERGLDAPLATSLATTPGGEIVAGTADGTLLRLSVDGELLGSRSLGERLYGDLIVAEECLLALGWSPAEGHFVSCLAPDLEEMRWIHTGSEKWSTLRPLVRGDRVLVGIDELLVAVGLEDGATEWSCPVEGTPRGLASAGDLLYLGTVQGRLHAFPADHCADGRREAPEPTATP